MHILVRVRVVLMDHVQTVVATHVNPPVSALEQERVEALLQDFVDCVVGVQCSQRIQSTGSSYGSG